jgi:23S rRNA (cytosine1962-C5)-methyltransferase
VVLDPPSFARSKKVTFSAEKNYTGLLKEAIALTKKGGTILASTNASSFNMKKFKQFIDQAFKETKHDYKIAESYRLPEDFKTSPTFPEGDYLKVCFIQKLT